MGKKLTRRTEPRTLARSPSEVAVAAGLIDPNPIVARTTAFIEPERRSAMIAEAAYYKAERRGFDPGHQLDDWLTAEAEVDQALAQSARRSV